MSRLRKATNKLLKNPEYDFDDKEFYDEQEQDKIIKDFELDNLEAESQYKTAFVATMLVPTPAFLILPYCRHNSILSLFALTSIFTSVYILLSFEKSVPVFFFLRNKSLKGQVALTPFEKYLPPLNVVMAATVLLCGYHKHRPWMGYDYIWLLPSVSVFTSMLLRQWMIDSLSDINTLKNARYNLKGA